MSILKATKARANLYNLIDEIADYHQPIIITIFGVRVKTKSFYSDPKYLICRK